MNIRSQINDILQSFAPITLSEMESVKLMNRIDTKYAMPLSLLPNILRSAQKDYYVQEIDGKRVATYDTIYYDTDTLDMYIRHHDQQLVRQKIRVRQYVDSNLTFLEIKRKNNKGRTNKKRIAVPGFDISAETTGVLKHKKKEDEQVSVEEFIEKKSRYHWLDITPHLWTKFHRITLVNKAKTERLTIDMNLVWNNVVSGEEKTYTDLVIVELKRDGNMHSLMTGIMLNERIHPFKISKYCIGTAITSPELKRNRFKKKIRAIEKMLAYPNGERDK
ncbi:MAG: polyphosphate polymerase domain-containing protein [Paludibacteraceae bacterium]|nr:polyphosphate polymerase domain-containing protein [Paludibacteraceae bacterium]